MESSASGRSWRDRLDERGQARALTIAQRAGVPELLARVLAGRGVEADEVAAYLDPSIRTLMPDPHVLTDMQAAAARLAHAVIHDESVAIFGDYDVDGATASALLARYLRHCGLDPIVHIPGPHFRRLRAECRRYPRRSPSAASNYWSPSIAGRPAIEPLRGEEARPRRS